MLTLLCLPQARRKPVQVRLRETCGPKGTNGVNGCIPHVCFSESHVQLAFGRGDSVWGLIWGWEFILSGCSLGSPGALPVHWLWLAVSGD